MAIGTVHTPLMPAGLSALLAGQNRAARFYDQQDYDRSFEQAKFAESKRQFDVQAMQQAINNMPRVAGSPLSRVAAGAGAARDAQAANAFQRAQNAAAIKDHQNALNHQRKMQQEAWKNRVWHVQNALKNQQDKEQAEQQWYVESADQMDERVEDFISETAKYYDKMDPAAQQEFDQIRTTMRGIQGQRHKLMPGNYNQLLGEQLTKANKAAFEGRVVEPPPVSQYIEENKVFDSDGNWTGFIRNGQDQYGNPVFEKVYDVPADKSAEQELKRIEAEKKDHDARVAERKTQISEARARLRERHKEQEAANKANATNPDSDTYNPTGYTTKPFKEPSMDDIWAEIQREADINAGIQQKMDEQDARDQEMAEQMIANEDAPAIVPPAEEMGGPAMQQPSQGDGSMEVKPIHPSLMQSGEWKQLPNGIYVIPNSDPPIFVGIKNGTMYKADDEKLQALLQQPEQPAPVYEDGMGPSLEPVL